MEVWIFDLDGGLLLFLGFMSGVVWNWRAHNYNNIVVVYYYILYASLCYLFRSKVIGIYIKCNVNSKV